jgi:hypothetical protein
MMMLHDDGYNNVVALWSILNQEENPTEERHVHTSQAFESGAGESSDLPHIFCPFSSYLQL